VVVLNLFYFLSLKIDADEKDELQKEAEEMNELGIRKLPRDDDGPDPDKVPPLELDRKSK
jgi:hypothetical protein